MKKMILMALTGLLIVLAGCTGTSYSNLRNKEDKLIHNYLRRNHIHIIRSLPEDDVWEEKDYYKVPGYDDLYFHLHERGDSVYYDTIGSRVDTIDMTILINQTVVVRYKNSPCWPMRTRSATGPRTMSHIRLSSPTAIPRSASPSDGTRR